MSDPYLSAVLDEAERVAEQHDQIARSTDDPAHEYLRYAVLRLLEGVADETVADVPEIDGVTVGYGEDAAMFDSWGDDVEWWDIVPPREERTRFRIFYPDVYEIIPRVIVDVMAALGAWSVWAGNAAACGSYDHRERREAHYLWPEGHPVEERLHERLTGPAEAVAPEGGELATVRFDVERPSQWPRARQVVAPRTVVHADAAVWYTPSGPVRGGGWLRPRANRLQRYASSASIDSRYDRISWTNAR
jgi:hypothetical protein